MGMHFDDPEKYRDAITVLCTGVPTTSYPTINRLRMQQKVENGNVTEARQVIRPNKNGSPPAREVRAANDIQKATGVKPKMVPVRTPQEPGRSIKWDAKYNFTCCRMTGIHFCIFVQERDPVTVVARDSDSAEIQPIADLDIGRDKTLCFWNRKMLPSLERVGAFTRIFHSV
jgi:hypothetical protein